jgi:hypothetical protein
MVRILLKFLVIQKAMLHINDQYFNIFIQSISTVIYKLKDSKFGMKFCKKLINTYPELKNQYYFSEIAKTKQMKNYNIGFN